MPRYKITIEYDGTNYYGWQAQSSMGNCKKSIQPKLQLPTIQQAIEHAAFSYCGEQIRLTVAGRTDAGVHALGQIAHFDMQKFPKNGMQEICNAINAHLTKNGEQIAILKAEQVHDDFSARFDAQRRYYRYSFLIRRAPACLQRNRVWQIIQPLNVEAMAKAAQYLCGRQDFTSFRSTQCQAKNPLRSIDYFKFYNNTQHLQVTEQQLSGEPFFATKELFVEVCAKAFLHNQVRCMIGSLYNVGRGFWPSSHIKTILAARSRSQAGLTAPACGLYFLQVDY